MPLSDLHPLYNARLLDAVIERTSAAL